MSLKIKDLINSAGQQSNFLMNATSGMEKDHPLHGFIGSYHTTGRPKTTVESYYETFGIRPTP